MKWVKLHIGLLDNDAFRLLTAEARSTFLHALAIAGKQDQGGALAIRDVGPMSAEQIAQYTGLIPAKQKRALDELCRIGAFLYIRESDSAWCVSRWDEKTGKDADNESNRDRQRRHRERLRNNVSNGDGNSVSNALRNVTTVTDIEEEVEEEVEGESNARTRAIVFARFFYDAAVSADLIQEVPDPTLWASQFRGEATELLNLYGERLCAEKALAFIRAIKLGKIRRACSLRYLRECWDYRELTPMKPVGGRSSFAAYEEQNSATA